MILNLLCAVAMFNRNCKDCGLEFYSGKLIIFISKYRSTNCASIQHKEVSSSVSTKWQYLIENILIEVEPQARNRVFEHQPSAYPDFCGIQRAYKKIKISDKYNRLGSLLINFSQQASKTLNYKSNYTAILKRSHIVDISIDEVL